VCRALSHLLFLLLACVARPLCVNDTARGTHSHDVRLFSLSLSLSPSLSLSLSQGGGGGWGGGGVGWRAVGSGGLSVGGGGVGGGAGVPRHIRERPYEHARPRPKHEPNEARARQKGMWLLGWMSPRTHSGTWWLEIVVGRGVRWGGGMIQAVGCAGSGHSGSSGRGGLVRTAISSAISAPQCGMPPSGVATETGVSGTTVRLAGSYTRWWRKTSRARP
jgi:hypothetical protein